MEHCDILIIGAGAAGIAAAKSAWEAGCREVLLIDRKRKWAACCSSAPISASVPT